ncbi:MAG: hypothetical protein Tp152DCM46671_46 [Prokaryotic dsDNA virus sp.]|nr:MAG: hypothetical protein Tp152DCM46671_46 [Prokaryotic dsDNA virus sp.]|tara:strand:- start:39922 stop:40080 length:159 start_codon:yes stop_codon:yes gene_type:complete
MSKQGKKEAMTNQQRLENLKKQKAECEIFFHRLQGAIELLENMIKDEDEKTN